MIIVVCKPKIWWRKCHQRSVVKMWTFVIEEKKTVLLSTDSVGIGVHVPVWGKLKKSPKFISYWIHVPQLLAADISQVTGEKMGLNRVWVLILIQEDNNNTWVEFIYLFFFTNYSLKKSCKQWKIESSQMGLIID